MGIGAFTGDSDPAPQKTSDPQAALDFSAPPRADIDAAACAKVLAQLPVTLGSLPPRKVNAPTPFVVAWGDPAVVLRCGLDRPKSLAPGSATEFRNAGSLDGPYFDIEREGNANVWTSVDRAAYISVTIPAKYPGGNVMPPLATALGKALPPVCSTDPTAPLEKLCTRRK